MKTKLILLTLLLALTVTSAAQAAIPHVINFQGKATDKAGAPLDGDYKLTIRIYDAATVGNLEWTEIHTGVTITNGVFRVLLGSVTPLDLPFNEDYWLSLEVNTDGEMSPRTRLASTGYAYKAKVADRLAEEIESIPSGGIIMWSGSIASIPIGWALCDGTNGTPDLRDKFIVGAKQDDNAVAKTNIKGTLQQAGGVHEVALTVDQMPAHSHTIGGAFFKYDGDQGGGFSNKSGPTGTSSTGGSQPHENCPPFYALAFIMKM